MCVESQIHKYLKFCASDSYLTVVYTLGAHTIIAMRCLQPMSVSHIAAHSAQRFDNTN